MDYYSFNSPINDSMNYVQNPYINQMQPILSNNPTETDLTLFKELSGFPNYGNPSGNADILYTGNQGTWTFEVPAFFFVPGLLRAEVLISGVLDDKQPATPIRQYSATITINGRVVHRGALPLQHGRPFGAQFDNWQIMRFNVRNLRRVNTIEIRNTSTGAQNDWIGLDWIEMRFSRN